MLTTEQAPAEELNLDVNMIVAGTKPKELAWLIKALPVDDLDITREPETGLVMMTSRDCFDTEFCLGEVLVTVAEVGLNTSRGYGMVLGDEPQKALVSASLDAIFRGDDKKLKSKLTGRLRRIMKNIISRQATEEALAASTRVAFETMPEG